MGYKITEAQAAELLKIAEALVGKQIQRGLIAESDRNDYIQELMLVMVQHQDDWTVPTGVRFESYAHTVMEKRLLNIWEKFHPKRDIMKDALSLNATFVNTDGEEEEYINMLTENGMMVSETESSSNWTRGRQLAEIRLFVETLPEDEQELCETLMYCNKVESARVLGKHKQSVWRMMDRIREKMLVAGFHPSTTKKSEKNQKGCDLLAMFF